MPRKRIRDKVSKVAADETEAPIEAKLSRGKRKRLQKRERFEQRLEFSKTLKDQHRANMKGLAGVSNMDMELPSLDDLPEEDERDPLPSAGKMTHARRKRLALRTQKLIESAVSHPAYEKDPFKAMQQHLAGNQ